jgi:hypothetical protein
LGFIRCRDPPGQAARGTPRDRASAGERHNARGNHDLEVEGHPPLGPVLLRDRGQPFKVLQGGKRLLIAGAAQGIGNQLKLTAPRAVTEGGTAAFRHD